MNFVAGALLLGKISSDPMIFEIIANKTKTNEINLSTEQRYLIESEVFWAMQVILI